MSEDKKIEVKKQEKTEEQKQEDQKSRELSVRRESPFSLFQQMDRLFNDLQKNFFDDMYWPFGMRRRQPLSLIIREDEPIFRTPLANITEDEKFYNITAELPGMDKGDLEISIQDGKLEIKGEQKEETKEEKDGELIRREYHSSSYYRAFSLPENIDENAIEANLDKGLLKVKLPKVEPPEPVKKKIEIK
jgi:HSP20 family protein